jgi:hypothetical protein
MNKLLHGGWWQPWPRPPTIEDDPTRHLDRARWSPMMVRMEDDAYARELWAILTNPTPTGIEPDDPYGQADDGIDRYNGFGRDVWVESRRQRW